jgi:ubiquitin carboxyl-terminal hydrolase 9/24
MKVSQRNWAEVFGEGNMFAISPVSTFQKVNIVLSFYKEIF